MKKTHQEQSDTQPIHKKKPALTPEARENQCIAMAYNLVEKRLQNGTATAQEVVHFLKLGTAAAQLEKEKLKNENQLIQAKVDALQSSKHSELLYEEAIAAMKAYSGHALSSSDEEE